MDITTYTHQKNELHALLKEKLVRFERMFLPGEDLDVEEDLSSVQIEIEYLQERIQKLESEVREGFIYKRPGNAFVNKLLPPLPFNQKDSIIESFDDTDSPSYEDMWGSTMIILVVSVGYVFIASGYGVIFYNPFSILSSIPGFANVNQLLILGVYFVGFIFSLVYSLRFLRPAIYRKSEVEKQKRFLLGSYDWLFGQQMRACAMYALSSYWVLLLPFIVFPLRFILITAGMFQYGMYARLPRDGAQIMANTSDAHGLILAYKIMDQLKKVLAVCFCVFMFVYVTVLLTR